MSEQLTFTSPLDGLRTAREHCTEQCFSYHAAWGLFRTTGLKGTPRWHTGFYRTALEHWERPPGRLRVLVAGAADHTVLNVLERLLGSERLEIHVIDACPTPLALCRAHAYWTGLRVTERQDHAPELATCDGNYDLIITDGLLSLLTTPEQRTATVARFAKLLARDGLLLYTARIAGDSGALEYDQIGRHIMAVTALTSWPGSARERISLAHAERTRPSRPAPFSSTGDVAACFEEVFATVRTHTRTAPHTVPLALAPSVRAGRGSTSVGITATGPHPRSRP
ncbi:class I SAM-dependent methyltransferase [Streptomyces sp. TR02-1]|uniref:class I SAM-dependent methyltransferase n=1 Tax=Streptomyces sp. TR02-1 TaxID=3385977 RepID=UPI0039A15826